jgi:hypothetical protein
LQVWPKFARFDDEPWNTLSRQMILPDVPISENIKDFLYISIRFAQIFEFIKKFYKIPLFNAKICKHNVFIEYKQF